jgi:nucleoside triphosphate pyrophosphatase
VCGELPHRPFKNITFPHTANVPSPAANIIPTIRKRLLFPLACYTCPVPLPLTIPLVLASQSPRRRELLATAGIPFTVRVADVEEIRAPAEPPDAYARRLARAKAEAVWQGRNEIVLGADTIVVLDQEVLEKPRDAADARAMLHRLAGREHTVITAICLRHPGGAQVDSTATRVRFTPLTDAEIDAYVASGEPMDKAGAYAIQGLASRFVERVEGCYFNVIGLPLSQVYRYLKSLEKVVA